MERKIHSLVQGSPDWHQFRLEHDGASEAAAMLGLSKKVKRNELLRMKKTGVAREFSDWVQENILDHGHEVEAMARPIVEKIIGEDLYPATYSYGRLSASCDGLTMSGEIAFEHKQWNAELAKYVDEMRAPPDEHMPQCQQVMLVTGAEKLFFVVSDGTEDRFVHAVVLPDKAWQDRIIAGWKQFNADLETYEPPEVIPAAVAAPVMALPAVSIQVQGKLALVSNLDLFGEKLQDFIKGIPAKPSTDQEFADCKAACKALQDAQDALDAAEAAALGQVASFDEMKRTKAMLFNLARETRLTVEKLVVARERQIKEEIVSGGKTALAAHIDGLNKRLGKPYMPAITADFAGAIKSKRTVASLQNAVDTELARAKIEANAVADRIQINLNTLREEAREYAHLFADTAQIVLKANDDLTVLVKSRIAEFKQAEEKRLNAERERIRAEEEAKARAAVVPTPQPAQIPAQTTLPPAATGSGQQVIRTAGPQAVTTTKPKVSARDLRPTDDDIIAVLALHYRVHESTIVTWLLAMDLKAASDRLAEEFKATA